MAKQEEIKTLVEQLRGWTVFSAQDGQPAASTFYVDRRDLVAIRLQDPNRAPQIVVRHRACRGWIYFHLDELDPIMSEYVCSGYESGSNLACGCSWSLTKVRAMAHDDLVSTFYTELRENPTDLREWPSKLIEVEKGSLRYTALAPLTETELLTARVKRLLAVRGET